MDPEVTVKNLAEQLDAMLTGQPVDRDVLVTRLEALAQWAGAGGWLPGQEQAQ